MKMTAKIAIGSMALSLGAAMGWAHSDPPLPPHMTSPSFSVSAPSGFQGYFCADTDVWITVTHDCTNASPLTTNVNLGKKAIGHYDHEHYFKTISGEGHYSTQYWYTVVDVEGSARAASLEVGGEVNAHSKPVDIGVGWQEVGRSNRCESRPIDITTSNDAHRYWVTVNCGSGDGSVTVKAMHPSLSSCSTQFVVQIIGCQVCQGQDQQCGSGSSDMSVCSLNAIFRLGQGTVGGAAGLLQVRAETPGPDLSTPRQLSVEVYDPLVEVMRLATEGAGNVLRQIKAPECLADVVPNSAVKYEIRFYKSADAGAKDTNGLYVPTGTSFVSYTLENPAATTNDFDTLRITENRGGSPVVYEYIYTETAGVSAWALISGNGLKAETLSTQTNATGRVQTRTVKDASGQLGSKTRTTFRNFDWGAEVVERVEDPDGAALTTRWSYYDEDAQLGQYGQLASVVNPDGSWTRYDYDSQGRRSLEISSWLDAPTNAAPSAAKAIYNNYTPVDSLDDGTALAHQPRLVEEKILGITVAKNFYAYYYDTNNPSERIEIEEQAPAAAAAYGAAGNLRTTRVYYPVALGEPDSGKIKSVSHPDGRLDSFDYEAGDYAAGTFAANPTGTFVRATTVHGTVGSPVGIANRTTQEITGSDRFDRTVLQEQYVYTGSGYDLIAWTQYTLDEFGRELSRRSSNGEQVDATWACCGKDYEKDANGSERTFSYDALKRLVFSAKAGIAAGEYPAQDDITTTYIYDAAGRQLTAMVSAGSLSQVSSNVYDLAGRKVREVNAAGLVSENSYANGGRTVTETLPGGFTRITERFKDGRIKSITGTAQINEYYEYGVNANGTRWTKIYSASNNSPVWVKTTTDLLGRSFKEEKPGYAGTETTENFYNNNGQLVKTTTTGRPVTLFAYDELGNQIRSGLDIDANGTLDLAGTDRISESEISYVQINNAWWNQTVNRLYATDNSATPLTTSITREKLTGLSGGRRSVASALDSLGNETITTVTIDRNVKKVTQTTDLPNSSLNVVNVLVNGLLQSSTTAHSQQPTVYSYDSLGRQTRSETGGGSRSVASVLHYDSHGRVDYTEDAAGNRTTLTYDPTTGRLLSKTDPLSNTTYYAYTSHGQLEKIWGSAVYPVLYEYDGYNRMVKMSTYRNGTGWEQSTWPANQGTADNTEWIYHEASGLLKSKKDAAGKEMAYTYAAGSKLASRTWARVNGSNSLVTTYSYNNSGDLIGVDYSDATPDVSFTYDRLGRQKTASSSVSSHEFVYSGLLLDSETIISPAGTNIIDRSYDFLGRAVAAALRAVADPVPSYQVFYSYDDLGRFNQISNFQFQASYSYLPNSDLIETLSTDHGLLTTRTYEPNRNLLTQIENSLGTNVISSYTYANDALGRRISTVWAEEAFGDTSPAPSGMGPTVMKYAYNSRSEVIGAERFFGSDPSTATEPVAGQNWGCDFDPIGNRKTASRDGDTEVYTVNNLNQYTQRIIPGSAHVAGTAAEDATVTINRPSISGISVEPVTRQGGYFHKKLLLDNSGHADREAIEVIGVQAGAGSNGMDIVSAYTGFVWAAKSPEQFTYDDDGNMLSDALRQYEWDGENRLIAATASNVVDGSLTRVEFAYDYMSRRVSKRVYKYEAEIWNLQSEMRFAYDGWNLIRETTTATGLGSITDDYIWGLDLSGSLQGAGGIGGLLARYRTEHRYYDGQDMLLICHRPPGNPENKQTVRINENAWPTHEAHGDTLGACDGSSVSNSAFLYTYDGNGNVSELLQFSPQSIVAHYEYGPFGELVATLGLEANDNKFRFSTKYFTDELGLGDWGRRWYHPDLGRWLLIDPLGIIGGLNTYLFVDNHPFWGIDPIGLHTIGVNEPLPETEVYAPIPDMLSPSGYDAGRIMPPPPFVNTYLPRCDNPAKPPCWTATITLTLELKTEIVAEGVQHPITSNPRTSAGVARTKSHEKNHRTAFKNEFEKFKGYYAPVQDQRWYKLKNLYDVVEPIKKKVDNEWEQTKSSEMSHTGEHWDTWKREHRDDPEW